MVPKRLTQLCRWVNQKIHRDKDDVCLNFKVVQRSRSRFIWVPESRFMGICFLPSLLVDQWCCWCWCPRRASCQGTLVRCRRPVPFARLHMKYSPHTDLEIWKYKVMKYSSQKIKKYKKYKVQKYSSHLTIQIAQDVRIQITEKKEKDILNKAHCKHLPII